MPIELNDNTYVYRPLLITPIKYKLKPGELFFTKSNGKKVLVKHKNEQVSSDNRTNILRKKDYKEAELKLKLYFKAKKELNNIEHLNAMRFFSPATYVGAVIRNNNKSYTENMLSGEGFGNEFVNLGFDVLSPLAIGGTRSLAANVAKKFPYGTNTSLLRNSVKWPWTKNLLHLISPEQLSKLKKEFLLLMDLHGLEFEGSKLYPELVNDILEGFLRPGTVETIVPKNRSDIDVYLNWMDLNFNISTPRKAKAFPASSFKIGVGGDYNYGTLVARINTAYPLSAESTFIHELGSHGTDMLVADRLIEGYPFTLRYPSITDFLRSDIGKFRLDPTVLNIYSNIANISPGLKNTIKNRLVSKNFKPTHGTNFLKNSNKWQEARSTLNEIRFRLFKQRNFPDSLKYLERAIDQTSDERILNLMRTSNGYGNDYYRAYNLLPPKLQKLWMERIRHAMKYLPATIPFAFHLNTNEE